MLRIHPPLNKQHDSLLEDLELHPLDPGQKLIEASDKPHHMLSANGIVLTEALTNWIVGRLDRVEVVSPVCLRMLIASRIDAVPRQYQR